jgi:membrane-bound lytic murein transglycosylase B
VYYLIRLNLPMLVWLGIAAYALSAPALARTQGGLPEAEVERFVGEMVKRHDFNEVELRRLLAGAKLLPKVLGAISRPAEAKPWHKYRPIFLTPERVRGGVEFWKAHRQVLDSVADEYGVAPEIIVAIIGVETLYGRRKGNIKVLDSLATLAFGYPKRSRFFREELRHFLLLAREEQLDVGVLRGSYAGAMGLPQFISSSYRRYAVDYDGDQVRDLLTNSSDAIASVANYLKRHGWQRGQKIAFKAGVDERAAGDLLKKGSKPHARAGDLAKRGVRVDGNIPARSKVALIRLEGVGADEYWIVLQNFYTITRYNHSNLYAMAVFQLAEAIRDEYIPGAHAR